MSNPFVEVDIIRQPSPFAPHEIRTRTKSFVRLEGSVAELRKALVEGQVIKPGDKFYTSEGALSQHSEVHTKWTEVLRGVLVVTGDEVTMNEPSTVPSVTAYHHSHDSTLRIPTVVDHHVAHQTGNLVVGDTIHHPQPLAKPAERTPELVLSSAVSDTSDVGTAPATPNYHTTCACPACQASAAPVVVEQPDTVILPVPKDFVVCEPPVLKVTEIEPSATVTQISAIEKLQVESVATDVTDGCHETIVLDEQVSATSTLCPCEACQSREAAVERVIAVEEKPQDAQAITDSDRQNLLLSSGLGSGVDISDIARPNKTSLPVVARVDVYSVHFVELDAEVDDVFVTSSPRAAGYAQEGWSESTLDIEHPWVSDDGDVTKTAESEWGSAVQVTGRHVISKYEVTLDTAIKPHPQFESAIQVALEIENAAKRSIELGKVFGEYGHFYIAAVELGGMKHATYRKTLSDNETAHSLIQDMRSLINNTYHLAKLDGPACPCAECQVAVADIVDDKFETVGGVAQQANTFAEWKASLAEHSNWAVTRITRVKSVIDLFDDVTRAKILAVVPQAITKLQVPTVVVNKVPLHRLFSTRSGEHFYTTKSAELDSAVGVYGFNYETLAAHILPEQEEETVPLFRVHRGEKHLYTISAEEKNQYSTGGAVPGIVGYVYATHQTGTFPLYRIFNPRTSAHLFTTNVNEKNSLLKVGWNDEGIACFVYL